MSRLSIMFMLGLLIFSGGLVGEAQSAQCDTHEISETGFIPNTPFFSLYNTFYDIQRGARRDRPDLSYLNNFSASWEKSFNRSDFIKNIILLPSRFLYSQWFPGAEVSDYIPDNIGPFEVKIVDSGNVNIVSTEGGIIYISSGILSLILDSTINNFQDIHYVIDSAIKHYVECSPYESADLRNDVFFSIRYMDEYINSVIMFMLIHEIAHHGFGHFSFRPSSCKSVNEMETQADLIAFLAYLTMLEQLLGAPDTDPEKVKTVHFTPRGLLDIANLAFRYNADINQIMQKNTKCRTNSAVTRAEIATDVMSESIENIRRKLDYYNEYISESCNSISIIGIQNYCNSRISRIPKILQ